MEIDLVDYEMVGEDTIEGDSLVDHPPKAVVRTKGHQRIIAGWFDTKGSYRSGIIEIRRKSL